MQDFHAELHVPTDGDELQRTLTSSVLRDWATNTNTSRPSAKGDASETSTARDCGEQVGALLSVSGLTLTVAQATVVVIMYWLAVEDLACVATSNEFTICSQPVRACRRD